MNIAINIEFVEGEASMGTGTQVYALKMADLLIKKHNVTIYLNEKNNDYININDMFSFYKLSEIFKNKIRIKYYSDQKSQKNKSLKRVNGYIDALREINKNYDLFIQTNITNWIGTKHYELINKNAAKAIHIVHFPFIKMNKYTNTDGMSKKEIEMFKFLEDNYLNSYDLFLCNSMFTKKAFHQVWGKCSKARCLYPPVFAQPINKNKIKNKENIIVTIGRISPDKRILELASTFVKLSKNHSDYQFIILGQLINKDKQYYSKVKNVLKGCNYKIIINPDTELINEFLSRSKFYWHAKGYNVKYKHQLEHFGMSTVEAMAKGCVPIVINGGGQTEIVKQWCGARWDFLDKLQSHTEKLINDDDLRIKLAKNSVEQSKKFNEKTFMENFNKILSQLE